VPPLGYRVEDRKLVVVCSCRSDLPQIRRLKNPQV
jgi:hypothetical protein